MSGATTRSPFPWLPIIAIFTALVSNAYAISSVFPYVGYMVQVCACVRSETSVHGSKNVGDQLLIKGFRISYQ